MKKSHIDTENEENPKKIFSRVLCIFPKFLTDFVNWNVDTRQQGKIALPSKLRKKINAVFQTETIRNWHRKRQKFEYFPIGTIFDQFLSK